jgi:alginate O-acetyltransferase complex protein AlgI
MLFNSIEFAVFLPLVFFIYWFIVNRNLKWQNHFLLAASYFFYGWWDVRFLALLFFSSTVDFWVAYYLDRTEIKRNRKILLALTLVSNLSILGFFKYFNFFVDSFASLLGLLHIHASVPTLRIILPVGISFYTFQSISYVIDVYRKQTKPSNDYFTFITFVSFFPQLVAGPIERSRHMLPQFERPRQFNNDYAVAGLRFILYGLLKKVVIADNLAKFVDVVYNNPGNYTGISAAVATLFFSIQIYCDFSGYSDIAVGTARLLGFELMQNFRTPYFSTSIREFWQRWHISLSTWFRDYLYIPLGGNRVREGRKYYNLFITFLVSGLWHGANFTFVIWGLIHGLTLIIEEFINTRVKLSVPIFFKWLLTFSIVTLAWAFFRAKTLQDAATILSSLNGNWSLASLAALFIQVYHSPIFITTMVGIIFLFFLAERQIKENDASVLFSFRSPAVRLAVYYLLIITITFVGLNDSAPNFIYFKF